MDWWDGPADPEWLETRAKAIEAFRAGMRETDVSKDTLWTRAETKDPNFKWPCTLKCLRELELEEIARLIVPPGVVRFEITYQYGRGRVARDV